jgi:RNA polymerase sigma-70 factor, ECF subfamily
MNAGHQNWREFYRRMWPLVFYTAYKLTGDRAAAEDIAQETFIRFLRYSHANIPSDEKRLEAYLRQMTRHACFDLRRRDRRQDTRKQLLVESADMDSGDPQDHRILQEDVEMLFNELSAQETSLLILLLEGRSFREIASNCLNVSYNTVAARVHRLRNKIRSRISTLEG